jgi:hypothetical protein
MTADSRLVEAASSDKNAPSGKPWSYGIRTWEPEGRSHGGFQWDLTPGSRTTAPDWKSLASCGNGLHANHDGWGDWSLLNLSATKVVGIVRWDPDLAVDLDGKVKAPWMEVVMTSQGASLGSIYGFIQGKWRDRMVAVLKAEGAKTNMASGYKGHAAASGDYGHAAASGSGGHAAASGDYGHAAASGDYGHAAASGSGGHAAASGDYGHAAASGSGGHAAASGDYGHAAASGDYGHAAASGSGGHAAASGDYGHAAASGYKGHAAASGDYGHAAASGSGGHAAASGASGVAASLGGGQAKAGEAGAIVLTAYGYDKAGRYVLKAIKSGMVGKKIGATLIKADTWYTLSETGVVKAVANV